MNLCRVCDEPLVLEFDSEDVEEATSSARGGAITAIPDDLELQCKCHFHWLVLLPLLSFQLVHHSWFRRDIDRATLEPFSACMCEN